MPAAAWPASGGWPRQTRWVDSDYRGEFIVALHNHGTQAQTISTGERIAQLVVTPVLIPEYIEVETLSDTQRGAGGFGSTGR